MIFQTPLSIVFIVAIIFLLVGFSLLLLGKRTVGVIVIQAVIALVNIFGIYYLVKDFLVPLLLK